MNRLDRQVKWAKLAVTICQQCLRWLGVLLSPPSGSGLCSSRHRRGGIGRGGGWGGVVVMGREGVKVLLLAVQLHAPRLGFHLGGIMPSHFNDFVLFCFGRCLNPPQHPPPQTPYPHLPPPAPTLCVFTMLDDLTGFSLAGYHTGFGMFIPCGHTKQPPCAISVKEPVSLSLFCGSLCQYASALQLTSLSLLGPGISRLRQLL